VFHHHPVYPTKIDASLCALTNMTPQQRLRSPQKGGRLLLASQAYGTRRVKSQYRVAQLYSVPRTTLRDRLSGVRPKAVAHIHQRKLQPTEEQSLVQWILNLDRRGFPPHIIDVRRMADVLLAGRGQNPPPLPFGKNWVSRFVNNQPEL
jgi:hypothetical protein